MDFHTYDILGRPKKMEFAGTADYVELTYDSAGRVTDIVDTRLPAAEFPTQRYTLEYDKNDRLTTVTHPDNAVMVYAYDSLGRRTSMTDPDGNTTTYQYATAANNRRLSRVSFSLGGQLDFSYDATTGLPVSQNMNNGYGQTLALAEFDYDSLLRPEAIAHTNPAGVTFHEESYQYNDASIRTRIDYAEEQSGNMVDLYRREFDYDSLYRLTAEAKKWAGSGTTAHRYGYQYDPAGNRTQLAYYNGSSTATTTYAYSDFNQLTTRTAYSYTIPYQYDDNGNRSFDGLYPGVCHYYAHDRADRLTTHTAWPNATLQASYVYDAAARRVLRTDASGNRLKVYFDGLSPVLVKEKPYGSSSWRTKKVYALKPAAIGQIIAERENTAWNAQGQPTAYTVKLYSYDLLGNVVAVTDYATGQVTKVEMEAFGNVLTGGTTGPRLTTKEQDAASGLYWFGARWYDPTAAQWMEKEPFGFDGPNYFGYVSSNPLYWIDRTGLCPDDAAWVFNTGGSATIGFGGWTLGLEGGVAGDTNGQSIAYFTYGFGGGVSLGGGVGVTTGAGKYVNGLDNFLGPSAAVFAGGGSGPMVSGTANVNSKGASCEFGLAQGSGVTIGAMRTNTIRLADLNPAVDTYIAFQKFFNPLWGVVF